MSAFSGARVPGAGGGEGEEEGQETQHGPQQALLPAPSSSPWDNWRQVCSTSVALSLLFLKLA